jgi:type I restriction enzyme S subunit
MTAYRLKPGWKLVKFGEVVKNANLVERDPEANGIERIVGLEHIDPENLHIRHWNSAAAGTSFTRRFVPGQTLFGKRRAYQRKVAYAEFEGICSGDILTFEPKDRKVLLPELLPFICQSDAFFDHALGTSAGSLSPRTGWSALQEFKFALPPLSTQGRIAEVLWAADDALEKALVARASVDAMRRKMLFHVFACGAGPNFRGLTHASATGPWPIRQITDAGEVMLGRQRAPQYLTGADPKLYLRVANVFDDYIDTSDVQRMDFNEDDFKRYRLKSGDVLLNEGQSRELVGRCAMFSGEIEDCCFQKTLHRFRAGSDVLPWYAFFYLQYLYYRQTFSTVAIQTTSIAHLTLINLKKILFPVPTLEEQEEVIRTMQRYRAAMVACDDQILSLSNLRKGLVNCNLFEP